MLHFTESGFRFSFPASWRVIRYDAHRHFRRFSGIGYKGVDFLALSPGRELVLLEVKNLAQYPAERDWPILLEELTDSVGQKVEDTLQGIDAVGRRYRSRWWHPWLHPLTRWESLANRWEWHFWERAAAMAAEPKKISVILWLHCPSAPPGWQAQLRRQLRADLQTITANVLITNRPEELQGSGWEVAPVADPPEKPDA